MTITMLLTIKEVKSRLRVSTATVYNLIASGDLPKVKIRSRTFVRPADVTALIERSVSSRAEESK
jgi:excisionase family DNA binding protein